MSKQARNSMAAVMTVLVTIVMWMTAIIGVVFLASVGAAIFAHHHGGTIDAMNISVMDGTDSLPALIAGLIGGMVVIPAIIYICVLMRRILATLAEGDPFVPENAMRLTRVAATIAVTQLLRIAVALVIGLSFDHTKVGFSFDLIAWASVAALFILSQVFREGTRLRDEEKMTI
jgi:membrane protein YdbS with pleckstrin-like domain